MNGDRANSLLLTNWVFSCLLVLCLVCCSASGQSSSTADGLAYSVRPYTLLTVQAVGPEGLLGTWPRVLHGDMILAINEVPVLSPEMLSDQHFCSGQRSLLILRPWGNQYFETFVRQPGCLFKFGRIAFVPIIRPLVTVEQVFPSSLAARLGLQSGDILYRAGLYSAFGTPQMISARLAYAMARGPYQVYVVRNGQMIRLSTPAPVAPAPVIVQAQQSSGDREPATTTASTVEAQSAVQSPAMYHTSLLLVNETPFPVSAAVHITIDSDHERTDAWYTLLPGEKKQLSYESPNQPTFSVYGESRSVDSVRWVHPKANSEATLYFEGSDDDQFSIHPIHVWT